MCFKNLLNRTRHDTLFEEVVSCVEWQPVYTMEGIELIEDTSLPYAKHFLDFLIEALQLQMAYFAVILSPGTQFKLRFFKLLLDVWSRGVARPAYSACVEE